MVERSLALRWLFALDAVSEKSNDRGIAANIPQVPRDIVYLGASCIPSGTPEEFRSMNFSFFWVRSCLYIKSDSVHSCTETFFIFQEILRAKSDCGA
jgi:hypothetical protein